MNGALRIDVATTVFEHRESARPVVARLYRGLSQALTRSLSEPRLALADGVPFLDRIAMGGRSELGRAGTVVTMLATAWKRGERIIDLVELATMACLCAAGFGDWLLRRLPSFVEEPELAMRQVHDNGPR